MHLLLFSGTYGGTVRFEVGLKRWVTSTCSKLFATVRRPQKDFVPAVSSAFVHYNCLLLDDAVTAAEVMAELVKANVSSLFRLPETGESALPRLDLELRVFDMTSIARGIRVLQNLGQCRVRVAVVLCNDAAQHLIVGK
jgi:hypothetical protein